MTTAPIIHPAEHFDDSISVNTLILELDHYRRQSEWLSMINALHARLAGAVDIAGMIEAFSIWMMPLVGHDLIGFNSPRRNRMHLFCSCHGPDRRTVMDVAEKNFSNLAETGLVIPCNDKDCHIQNFQFHAEMEDSFIVLLRRNQPFEPMEERLIHEAIDVLSEPLMRALDYEDLFELARRDSLTGLANRRVFEERIMPILESSNRHGHPVTLASMDLDKFKEINDNLGHAMGDEALRKTATTLAGMVRSSDLLVRMGGDEFLLVMPDTEIDSAQFFANRLCQTVDSLDICASDTEKLGISIGLAKFQQGMSLEEWMLRADEALYQAKANGRAQVCRYE